MKKWSVARGPRGLSVNSEHNLIVACCDANTLHEYTTHGSLVRNLDLRPQAGVTRPWQAILCPLVDRGYVLWSVSTPYTSPGVVSLVGVDGQVICRYGLTY